MFECVRGLCSVAFFNHPPTHPTNNPRDEVVEIRKSWFEGKSRTIVLLLYMVLIAIFSFSPLAVHVSRYTKEWFLSFGAFLAWRRISSFFPCAFNIRHCCCVSPFRANIGLYFMKSKKKGKKHRMRSRKTIFFALVFFDLTTEVVFRAGNHFRLMIWIILHRRTEEKEPCMIIALNTKVYISLHHPQHNKSTIIKILFARKKKKILFFRFVSGKFHNQTFKAITHRAFPNLHRNQYYIKFFPLFFWSFKFIRKAKLFVTQNQHTHDRIIRQCFVIFTLIFQLDRCWGRRKRIHSPRHTDRKRAAHCLGISTKGTCRCN